MATANEIEAYQGDPRLGFGSSAAAGMTGVVWDLRESDAAWQHYADQRLAVAKDLHDDLKKKQLATQAEVAKALDSDEYKIWAADRTLFKQKYDEFAKMVIDVAKRGNWGNVNDPDFEKVLKKQSDLKQFAQYSTQQEENWKTTRDTAKSNPDNWIDPEKDLNAYESIGDPIKRADVDLNLTPQAGWDAFKNNDSIVKGLATENPDRITSKNLGNGNVIYSIPVELDQKEMVKKVNTALDNERTGIKGYEYKFQTQPDAIKQKYASQPDPARAWAFDVKLGLLPLDLESKNSIHQINYAPGSTSVLNVPYEETIPIPYTDTTEASALNAPLQQELDALNAAKPKTTAEKDANDKRIHELQQQIDANSKGKISTVYLIGGHDYTKTGNAPANILVTPTNVHDANTGQAISLSRIGTAAWNSDVMKEGHVYMNKDGNYILTTTPPPNFQEAQKYADRHGYTLKRVALINTDGGGMYDTPHSFLVPYSDVDRALQNSKVVNQPQPQQKAAVSPPAEQPKKQSTPKNTVSLSALKAKYDFGNMTDAEITKFYTDKNYEVTK